MFMLVVSHLWHCYVRLVSFTEAIVGEATTDYNSSREKVLITGGTSDMAESARIAFVESDLMGNQAGFLLMISK